MGYPDFATTVSMFVHPIWGRNMRYAASSLTLLVAIGRLVKKVCGGGAKISVTHWGYFIAKRDGSDIVLKSVIPNKGFKPKRPIVYFPIQFKVDYPKGYWKGIHVDPRGEYYIDKLFIRTVDIW